MSAPGLFHTLGIYLRPNNPNISVLMQIVANHCVPWTDGAGIVQLSKAAIIVYIEMVEYKTQRMKEARASHTRPCKSRGVAS